jgi:hypothetical protein
MSHSSEDSAIQLRDIGETLPEVPLQARRPSKKFTIFIFSVICLAEGLIIAVLIFQPNFFPLSSSPSSSSSSPLSPLAPLSLPLAVVDIHTSSASFSRLEFLHRKYFANSTLIQNGSIVVRAVVSQSATVKDDIVPISRVDCSDSHQDLPCRVDKSYEMFLKDFPNCGWLFRSEDDTFIDLEGFYRYVIRLNTQYRPEQHIVFRAHANPEKLKNWYVHGGGGWLSSRAFIDAHIQKNLSLTRLLPWARYHQQDTAESIVVRHLFIHPVLWDEYEIEGFACDNCKGVDVQRGNWAALTQCPDGIGVRIRDIWAMHTAGLQDNLIRLVDNKKNAPDDVLLFRDNMPQRGMICLKQPKSILWNADRRALAYMTIEDLPNSIIDYETLKDDNIN